MRHRLYSFWRLRVKGQSDKQALKKWKYPDFMALFSKDLNTTLAVYMTGPCTENAIKTIDDIAGGDYGRLDGWLDFAKKQGLLNGISWTVDAAIADISQNSEWRRAIHSKATPCLLTKTKLFDMVRMRLLTTDELWLVQGFPRPGMPGVPPEAARDFPCPDILPHGDTPGKITRADEAAMLGNSMHVAAVGHWLLFSATCPP